MLRVVEDKVAEYQEQYEKYVQANRTEETRGQLAHVGRRFDATLYWFSEPGLWVSFRRPRRYWNAYGFAKPRGTSPVGIDFEINFPFVGVDRRIGGALAQDEAGTVYMVHRGKLGGARPGLSKANVLSYFERHHRERIVELKEPQDSSTVILVGPLLGGLDGVAEFGRAVLRIKHRE
ncbi:MAG: hypothetical protein ACM3WU_09210 [Bacillota bacterium]